MRGTTQVRGAGYKPGALIGNADPQPNGEEVYVGSDDELKENEAASSNHPQANSNASIPAMEIPVSNEEDVDLQAETLPQPLADVPQDPLLLIVVIC